MHFCLGDKVSSDTTQTKLSATVDMATIYAYNISGVELPSLPQLQVMRAEISATIWRAFTRHDEWLTKVKLLMDGAKTSVVVAGPASAGMKIPFGGDISMAPHKSGSFQVADVNGVRFFLHGSPFTTISSECYQAAWGAKAIKTSTKHQSSCIYDFEETSILMLDKQITVRLPFLMLNYDVTKGEVVELTRPLMDALSDDSALASLGSMAYEKDLKDKVGTSTQEPQHRGSKRKGNADGGAESEILKLGNS